jgi:hypothetical protein
VAFEEVNDRLRLGVTAEIEIFDIHWGIVFPTVVNVVDGNGVLAFDGIGTIEQTPSAQADLETF